MKNIIKFGICLFFGILLAVAVMEIFLRITGIEGQFFWQVSKEYGWEHIPNQKGYYKKSEFRARVSINSKKLRNRETEYKKKKGVYRILFIGDSFTEGAQVDDNKHFIPFIEKKLLKYKKVELINGGCVGYATDQELLWYENELRKYEPDLVILNFFSNDIKENYFMRKRKPYYIIDENNNLILQNYPVKKPRVIGNFFMRHSYARRYFKDKWKMLKLQFKQEAQKKMPFEFEYMNKNLSADWKRAYKTTEYLIRKFAHTVYKNHSKFLIVYLPHPVELDEKLQKGFLENYNKKITEIDFYKCRDFIKKIAKENKIDYYDLSSALKAGMDKERLFFKADSHWTEAGHKIVAQDLAGIIKFLYFPIK